MADEENKEEQTEDLESEEQEKKLGKAKLIIILLIAVIVIAVPAALFFLGFFDSKKEVQTQKPGEEQAQQGSEAPKQEDNIFYDMEEFIVNLNVGSRRPSFLKMSISLEIKPSQLERVEGQMPKIRDSFQIYLRELRKEDLQGSAGLYRLREELLLRINKTVHPIKISDILFKEVLVQ